MTAIRIRRDRDPQLGTVYPVERRAAGAGQLSMLIWRSAAGEWSLRRFPAGRTDRFATFREARDSALKG